MATLVERISLALQVVASEIKSIKAKLPIYSTTEISDSNYTIKSNDRVVVLSGITTPRVFTLPDITTFPLSTFLAVGDSSGSLSETNYLDIVANASDSIVPFGSPIRLSDPNAVILFVRGSGRKWLVVQ